MAFTYTGALQGRIAYAVFNGAYSTLNAAQKVQLDGTWASGALTAGVAYDAYNEVVQLAQWVEQAASNPDLSYPQDEWDRLFVAKAAMILVKSVRPDRLGQFVADHEAAMDASIETFSKTLITANFAGGAFTVPGIRAYVVNHCVRRKESGVNQGLRRRIFPPIEDIDSHTQWVINYAWNTTQWNFRKRLIQITINANNSVSMTGLSGESFDSIASNRFYYDGGNYGACLEWVDSSAAPALKAFHGADTGQPQYFRTEANGATVTWHLFPLPDAAYTLCGTVFVATPAMTTTAEVATAISKFPPEVATIIRDGVLARVLLQHNASDADRMWTRFVEQVESFIPNYTDTGFPARQTGMGDVYADFSRQHDGGFGSGAFGYGY